MTLGPKDPIRQVSPEAQRKLFEDISALAQDFPLEHVVLAAANLLVNALRQTHPTKEGAERAYDELSARVKALLMSHYGMNGRKKGIFPYHQVITPECFVNVHSFPALAKGKWDTRFRPR